MIAIIGGLFGTMILKGTQNSPLYAAAGVILFMIGTERGFRR